MTQFYIAATDKTPQINFEKDGNLLIRGNSYAEDTNKFYQPLINWLNTQIENQIDFKTLTFDLNYINTSSIKQLLIIIIKINAKLTTKIAINWLYEKDDNDLQATGEDLQELCNTKFNFIEK